MQLVIVLLVIVGACLILSRSADYVVTSVTKLARILGVSEFNIGFFILGLATTTPEVTIGINAAIRNETQLSLGNLIGASIILLSFLIGMTTIINKEVSFKNSIHKKELLVICFVILAPAILVFDGDLSRLDGLILLGFYFLFVTFMNKRQTFLEQIQHTLEKKTNHLAKTIGLLIFGLITMLIAAKLIVESAHFIALTWHLPLILIGLILIALGTNLPELTVIVKSSTSKHKHIAVGDILGSAVANTPALGIIALLRPIVLESPIKVYFSLGMLALTILTFLAFFSSDRKLTRQEGAALVSLYIFFVFVEVFVTP